MNTRMLSIGEVAALIRSGGSLLLAGNESVLRELPAGQWIAGTIPYFMSEEGGRFSLEHISVVELPNIVSLARIKTYDDTTLRQVYAEAPVNGFSVIILPASSAVHLQFALKAPAYPDFAARPLVGWISGVPLDELGRTTPKVVDGRTVEFHENAAVVMHVSLPAGRSADIGIVNLFEPGDGDRITFPEDGFSTMKALVNGSLTDFAAYLKSREINTQLPLVADMCGAMINTSFKGVDAVSGSVDFYAPVFKGVEYRIARPVGDYVSTFTARMPDVAEESLVFSCNCILNYLFAELEGKKTSNFMGPVTFGEVAYQLLNQTLVYLTIEEN